jgi:hypothetical protein
MITQKNYILRVNANTVILILAISFPVHIPVETSNEINTLVNELGQYTESLSNVKSNLSSLGTNITDKLNATINNLPEKPVMPQNNPVKGIDINKPTVLDYLKGSTNVYTGKGKLFNNETFNSIYTVFMNNGSQGGSGSVPVSDTGSGSVPDTVPVSESIPTPESVPTSAPSSVPTSEPVPTSAPGSVLISGSGSGGIMITQEMVNQAIEQARVY